MKSVNSIIFLLILSYVSNAQLPDSLKEIYFPKLARNIVYKTIINQYFFTSDGFWLKNLLPCDWTFTAVGQSGAHHSNGLAIDFHRASLNKNNTFY